MSLSGRPERIFISVNEGTGRSTISFAPADAGTPILRESDGKGALALADAKAICDKYPGCTIHGPYFHAERPAGLKKSYRKAPNVKSKASE